MSGLYSLGTSVLRLLPPETAHNLTVKIMAKGLAPKLGGVDDAVLRTDVFGQAFPNPIGLAAGFDKNAEAYNGAFDLGFGFVEVGTVTPKPQEGNPKPRLFRLKDDKAVINRMGFNNGGLDAFTKRIVDTPPKGMLGINLGKNKTSEDAVADYVTGIAQTATLAGYLVVNVSSPNTPGLRDLQHIESLKVLIEAVRAARDETVKDAPPPLLLKVAPDLTDEQIEEIADYAKTGAVDGLIVSNTTISRPATLRDQRDEAGGLSGAPLMDLSTDVLKKFCLHTDGGVPLVGVGGVTNGADAYAKIKAGASLVQLYSALVYEGPTLVNRVKEELASLLRADGYRSVAEAVGKDVIRSS